jgi:diguanylate cyclase (GGDEF)-like protein
MTPPIPHKHTVAQPPGMEYSPFLVEFSDANAESRFQMHHLAEMQSQMRLALIVSAVVYTLFWFADIARLGYGPAVINLLLVRLCFVGAVVATLVLLHLRPNSPSLAWRACTAAEVIGAASFLVVCAYHPGETPWLAMSLAIMIQVIYLYIPNRLLHSTVVAVAFSLAFIWQASVISHLQGRDLLSMIVLLVLANAFGLVAARRYQRLLRNEFSTQSVLVSLSIHDPLTGCYNRRHLHEQILDHELTRAARYRLSLTVIMCDLDHFKEVNDNHGHHAGDAVLVNFADLLMKMTRDGIDSVVRYGGEEFLLILPETDIVGGTLLAERLRTALAESEIIHADAVLRVTASFGVATVDFSQVSERPTADQLVDAADRLMYSSKNNGRNQVSALQMP